MPGQLQLTEKSPLTDWFHEPALDTRFSWPQPLPSSPKKRGIVDKAERLSAGGKGNSSSRRWHTAIGSEGILPHTIWLLSDSAHGDGTPLSRGGHPATWRVTAVSLRGLTESSHPVGAAEGRCCGLRDLRATCGQLKVRNTAHHKRLTWLSVSYELGPSLV